MNHHGSKGDVMSIMNQNPIKHLVNPAGDTGKIRMNVKMKMNTISVCVNVKGNSIHKTQTRWEKRMKVY